MINGGGIRFAFFPFYQNNCIFSSNNASYGNDNGSYPYILRLSSSTLQNLNLNGTPHLKNISTGKTISTKLEIEICDMYYQRIDMPLKGFMFVDLIDENNRANFKKIEGITNLIVNNGSIIFDNLRVFSNPVNVTLILNFSCSFIKTDFNPILMLPIDIKPCETGEFYDEEFAFCTECPILTYSMDSKIDKCFACPEFCDCFGGMNISIYSGFWRPNIYSVNIQKCQPYEGSCLYEIYFDSY